MVYVLYRVPWYHGTIMVPTVRVYFNCYVDYLDLYFDLDVHVYLDCHVDPLAFYINLDHVYLDVYVGLDFSVNVHVLAGPAGHGSRRKRRRRRREEDILRGSGATAGALTSRGNESVNLHLALTLSSSECTILIVAAAVALPKAAPGRGC